MNIKIREGTLNDLDKGLLKVFIEGYRYHQNGRPDIFTNITDEELKNNLINEFTKSNIIVAVNNDIIVGYLAYFIKIHRKKLEVDQLIIKEEYRGKGLGKKLMEEAKKIAIENNCTRIELNCWLFNKNALDMYEHIGYTKQRIIYEYTISKEK